jgi:hypothetical protein
LPKSNARYPFDYKAENELLATTAFPPHCSLLKSIVRKWTPAEGIAKISAIAIIAVNFVHLSHGSSRLALKAFATEVWLSTGIARLDAWKWGVVSAEWPEDWGHRSEQQPN